jgi:hypothetical protein
MLQMQMAWEGLIIGMFGSDDGADHHPLSCSVREGAYLSFESVLSGAPKVKKRCLFNIQFRDGLHIDLNLCGTRFCGK